MVRRVAVHDVIKWIKEIQSKSLSVFTFEDLQKHDLAKQTFINRAKTSGLVRKIKKVKGEKGSITQWQII